MHLEREHGMSIAPQAPIPRVRALYTPYILWDNENRGKSSVSSL